MINGEQLVALDVRSSDFTSARHWRGYVLPVTEIRVLPSNLTSHQCVSDNLMETFDHVKYSHEQQGTYVLYRHKVLPHEVQVFYRRCNLRKLCHCSVAVRIEDLLILFDICSRGYLQVWAVSADGEVIAEKDLPDGIRLLSLDQGRSYEVWRPERRQNFLLTPHCCRYSSRLALRSAWAPTSATSRSGPATLTGATRRACAGRLTGSRKMSSCLKMGSRSFVGANLSQSVPGSQGTGCKLIIFINVN